MSPSNSWQIPSFGVMASPKGSYPEPEASEGVNMEKPKAGSSTLTTLTPNSFGKHAGSLKLKDLEDEYRFLTEPPFKFIVGEAKQEVYVHPGRITAAAAPGLHKLVTSPMKEGLERSAALPEEDLTTFLRFCQWAYSGSYTLAETSQPNKPREVADYTEPFHGLSHIFCRWCRNNYKTNQVIDGVFPFCSAPCRQTCCTTQNRNPRHYCAKCCGQLAVSGNYTASMSALCYECEVQQKGHSRLVFDWPHYSKLSNTFLQLQPSQSIKPQNEKQSNSTGTLNEMPSDDLIEHARVFVFADKWCIKDLESMALYKLHRDLCTFKLCAGNVSKVVELVDYVYDNTPSQEDEAILAADKTLRGLVLAYVEELAAELIGFQEFKSMLMEIPELAVYGFARLAKRPRLS